MKQTENLKNVITELITNSKDEALTKGLGQVLGELDSVDEEYNNLDTKYRDLVQDYGKLVIRVGSKEKPIEEPVKPKTLEDIVKEHTQK